MNRNEQEHNEGETTVNWDEQDPNEGETNVNWDEQDPDEEETTVTWVGCRSLQGRGRQLRCGSGEGKRIPEGEGSTGRDTSAGERGDSCREDHPQLWSKVYCDG